MTLTVIEHRYFCERHQFDKVWGPVVCDDAASNHAQRRHREALARKFNCVEPDVTVIYRPATNQEMELFNGTRSKTERKYGNKRGYPTRAGLDDNGATGRIISY